MLLRRIILPVLLAATALAVRAQDDEWKVGTEVEWASHQVFRGVEWAGSSLQGVVSLERDAFHARVDAGHSWRSGDPALAGLSAGYGWNLSENGPALAVDFRQQWFSQIAIGVTRSTTEMGLTAHWTIPGGLKPGLAWWHEFRRHADTFEASLGTEIPLTGWGTYLEADIATGWTAANNVSPDAGGAALKDAYGYAGAGLRLPYRIVGTHWQVVVGARFTESVGQNRVWSPLRRSDGAETAVTVGVRYDF